MRNDATVELTGPANFPGFAVSIRDAMWADNTGMTFDFCASTAKDFCARVTALTTFIDRQDVLPGALGLQQCQSMQKTEFAIEITYQRLLTAYEQSSLVALTCADMLKNKAATPPSDMRRHMSHPWLAATRQLVLQYNRLKTVSDHLTLESVEDDFARMADDFAQCATDADNARVFLVAKYATVFKRFKAQGINLTLNRLDAVAAHANFTPAEKSALRKKLRNQASGIAA